MAICGCNLGCRRRRRPSGLSLVAITCTVVRMMANSRRHHGRKAYAPTRSGIIINRAVSASLAALRAMPPGSRLSVTKGGLQPGAAPGCGRSRARLRRCADALRDRSAIAERRIVRSRCVTADSRRAARSQPGLGVRSELEICARIGREAETCPAVAARSEIKDPCPFVLREVGVRCGRMRPTLRGKSTRRERQETRAGSGDLDCVVWSVPHAFVHRNFPRRNGHWLCMQKTAYSAPRVCSFACPCMQFSASITWVRMQQDEGQPPKFQSAVAHNSNPRTSAVTASTLPLSEPLLEQSHAVCTPNTLLLSLPPAALAVSRCTTTLQPLAGT